MRNDYGTNYLAHHGILGQKWGVRRYQNADGSLTEAGKKHYKANSVDEIDTSEGYNKRIKDVKKAVKIINKKRGREYTKIANNPENFLGLNKKHAKKIDEYSEDIKKGNDEITRLLAKAKSEGYNIKSGKVKEKTTPKEKTISNPSEEDLQKEYKRYIENEIKTLEKQARDTGWAKSKEKTGYLDFVGGMSDYYKGDKDYSYDVYNNISEELDGYKKELERLKKQKR